MPAQREEEAAGVEKEIEEETISEREDIKPIILRFFLLLSSVFFCPQAPSDNFSEFSIREAAALWRGLSLYQTDRQEVNAAWQDLTKKKKHTEKC